MRFTQRTGDMVYIGLENLLLFPLLRWPLPGLLFGMAEGSHMRELVERTAREQGERRCTRPNVVHCDIASRTKTPRKIQLFPARHFRLTVERMPDSKPLGRWQNGLRRILDTLGQAALLRVRPGAFLFDLARLYTPAQRLDQPHHPQPGFCFCTCAGWVREGR